VKRFRIVIECQTPEGSDDSCAHAYASNVCDYVRGPLFVAGVGYQLGVQSVEYEMIPDEKPDVLRGVARDLVNIYAGLPIDEGRR